MSEDGPNLILAPVRGITDAVYRRAFTCCFGGFDRAIAPFVQVRRGQALRSGERRQLLPENNRDLTVIPQILTNHASTFAAALCELHDLGYDEVNWNLGCPHPPVAGRGRGAGLLPDPERIATILDQVLNRCPVRLSVKLRLGYRDADEFLPVFEVLNRHSLAEVILHPRTAAQMYGGVVDLERAKQAAALCRHPFVYNGDITTSCDFCELRNQFPAATAWMIGRGALSNPFLPAGLKGVFLADVEACRRRLRDFHDQLLEGYRSWLSGPGHLLTKMKEQWAYLAFVFADSSHVLRRVRHSHNLETLVTAVDWAFDQPLASVMLK